MKPTTAAQLLIIGLLITVSAACAVQGEPTSLEPPVFQAAQTVSQTAPSVPQNTLAAAQPMPSAPQTAPAVVSPPVVCDVIPLENAWLDEATRIDFGSDDNDTVSVEEATGSEVHTAPYRFVAYGDIDSDDDMRCGMLPDVRVAIIQRRTNEALFEDWWTAVGGSELGIERLAPPGVRVPSTAEKLSKAPPQLAVTGPDGTAEILLASYQDQIEYMLCAISPVEYLIAGCGLLHGGTIISDRSLIQTVYIYFTHGHAVIEIGSSDRYQRFLDGVDASDEPAVVWVTARRSSEPIWDARVAVVESAHVNDWWEEISEDGANELDMSRSPYVGSDVLRHEWVSVVATGPDGLDMITLPPGDYLLCEVTGVIISAGCLYEDLKGGRHHVFKINFYEGHPGHMRRYSEEEVERFLAKEDVERLLAIFSNNPSDE